MCVKNDTHCLSKIINSKLLVKEKEKNIKKGFF